MNQDEVRQLFEYEPDTGMLRRKGGRKAYPWRGAGRGRRYLRTTVNGRSYYLHRLVWLYHWGEPPEMIDHIDGDPGNNRIENLRECCNASNQYNVPARKHNTTGAKGVVFHAKSRGKPWQARITVAGRKVSLGYHETKELAAAAYAAGAVRIAGAFARAD